MRTYKRIKVFFGIIIFTLSLTACNSGGGSDLPASPPGAGVHVVSPADLSGTANPEDQITIQFSGSMAAGNFSESTLTVTSEFGDIIAGTIGYDDGSRTATFTPDAPGLDLHASYEVLLDLRNMADEQIASHDWRFTTREGVWSGTPVTLATSSTYIGGARLAMNRHGQAFAYWAVRGAELGFEYFNWDLVVKFRDPDSGWDGTPTKIDSEDLGGVSDYKLRINDNGHAVALWSASYSPGDSNKRAWTNYFTPPNGWNKDPAGESLATQLSVDSGMGLSFIYDTLLALDPYGNAITIWDQHQSPGVYASRYESGDTTPAWSASEKLNSLIGVGARAYNSQLKFDDNGNGIAVWHHQTTPSSILAVRYVWDDISGTGDWIRNAGVINPTKLNLDEVDAIPLSGASFPDMAMNRAGDAMVVYQQARVGATDIWARRFDRSLGWRAPVRIEHVAGACRNPKVAMNESGVAIAAWDCISGSGATRKSVVYANVFHPATGWQKNMSDVITATQLSVNEIVAGTAGYAVRAQVAIDRKGNSHVIWFHKESQGFNNSYLHAAHYVNNESPDGGWQTDASDNLHFPIDMSRHDVYGIPYLVMDDNGNLTVVSSRITPLMGSKEQIVYNRFKFGIGWNLNGSQGEMLHIESNDEDAAYGISGVSGVERDQTGNIIVNTWSQLGGTYRNRSYTFD